MNRDVSSMVDPATGNWRFDIERPPLGSLVGMLFAVLVDRLGVYMTDRDAEPMRASHLYVLRELYPGGASVTELAERWGVTKQAVSQIIDAMETNNVVVRVPNPSDGRRKRVTLTPYGEQVLANAVLSWGDVEQEWAALIGEESMVQVRQAMLAFIENHDEWHRGERTPLRPVW